MRKNKRYINVGPITTNCFLGWKLPKKNQQYVTKNADGSIQYYYNFDSTTKQWYFKDASGNVGACLDLLSKFYILYFDVENPEYIDHWDNNFVGLDHRVEKLKDYYYKIDLRDLDSKEQSLVKNSIMFSAVLKDGYTSTFEHGKIDNVTGYSLDHSRPFFAVILDRLMKKQPTTYYLGKIIIKKNTEEN